MWKWLKSILIPKTQCCCDCGDSSQYILIVDDSEVERQFYKKTLEKAGYEVLAASNAATAIESLGRRKPDLVISDLCMPDINGKEMCQRIKASEETEDVPLIFLTGSAKSGEVVECFDVGGEYFLEKPIDARTLVRQVQNILTDLEQEKSADGSSCCSIKE